ncbi:hypothetical protein A4S06_04220 [Erysipelotrichaceae bacterium MTC7]|nr:hypothetical protein A4S06_04220 [Erysipelotrichaceae bacterium MTC7]
MQLLQLQQYKEAYALLVEAFPVSEIRPYEFIEKKLQTRMVEFLGYVDGTLKGVFLIWKLHDFIFIENFAVAKQTRGEGIGSKMVSLLKQKYPKQTIILEVEKPFDQVSQRRVAFYQRNAFHLFETTFIQPQINRDKNIHPLCFMSYPKPLDETMYQTVLNEVFTNVYEVKM